MAKNPLHILVADDEEGIRFVLSRLLLQLGYRVTEASDGAQALSSLRRQNFDLAILDINMPKVSGMEVLKEARKLYPHLIILVITAYGSPELNQEAIREGAYDYFTKPFETDELRITIRRALEKKVLTDQIKELEAQIGVQHHFKEIIGVCDAMQDVFSIMQRVVDNDVPVLVMGESGTGKELVARAIHLQGARKGKPMVGINCAAIPESLLESELFGHEKGAFTGAVVARPGKFEQADGGTLFLDEIGDMPLALQAKILRAIQEKEIQRVGGKAPISYDARLITASNKRLAEEVAAKRFREDLFFRINVIAVELPPLRRRLADIPLLVDYFIKEYNGRLGKNVRALAPEAMDLFLQYDWPGNIRELENVIQRGLVMSTTSEIQPCDLPSQIVHRSPAMGDYDVPGSAVDLNVPMPVQVERAVEATERRYIAEALKKTKGRQEASDRLGISRKSLHNKMQRYGMMGNS